MNRPRQKMTAIPSRTELDAFSRKLDAWTQGLPEAEAVLGRLLVERARQILPEQVRRQALSVALDDVTRKAIKAVELKLNPAVEGWVEIGPIWYKRNEIEHGEDVEIVQHAVLKQQRRPDS